MDEIEHEPVGNGLLPCGRPRPPRLQRTDEVLPIEDGRFVDRRPFPLRMEDGKLVRDEAFRYPTDEPDISVAAWMDAARGRKGEVPHTRWAVRRQYNSWCWAWLKAWRVPDPSARVAAYDARDGRTLKRFRAAVDRWVKRRKVEEQVRMAAQEAREENEAGGGAP